MFQLQQRVFPYQCTIFLWNWFPVWETMEMDKPFFEHQKLNRHREVSVSLPPSASPPGDHCYEFLVEPSWEFSCKHFLFAPFLKTEMVTNNAHLLTICFYNLVKHLEVFAPQFLRSLLIPFYNLTSSLAIWVYNLQHTLRWFPIFYYYKPHSE